jgi:hypothetical protein
VHFDKIPKSNAVNTLNGYGQIGIYSPLEVMTTMIRESECVILKRRGAEHVAKLVAGMSLQEQLEFWRKRTEVMLARQKKSLHKQSIT